MSPQTWVGKCTQGAGAHQDVSKRVSKGAQVFFFQSFFISKILVSSKKRIRNDIFQLLPYLWLST
jgi:hypothetical protein